MIEPAVRATASELVMVYVMNDMALPVVYLNLWCVKQLVSSVTCANTSSNVRGERPLPCFHVLGEWFKCSWRTT